MILRDKRCPQSKKSKDYYSDHDLNSDGELLSDQEPAQATVGKLMDTLGLDVPQAKGKDYIITRKDDFCLIHFNAKVTSKRRNRVRDDWTKSNLNTPLVDGYLTPKGEFIQTDFVVTSQLPQDKVLENICRICDEKVIKANLDGRIKQVQCTIGYFSVYKKAEGSKILVQSHDTKLSVALRLMPKILTEVEVADVEVSPTKNDSTENDVKEVEVMPQIIQSPKGMEEIQAQGSQDMEIIQAQGSQEIKEVDESQDALAAKTKEKEESCQSEKPQSTNGDEHLPQASEALAIQAPAVSQIGAAVSPANDAISSPLSPAVHVEISPKRNDASTPEKPTEKLAENVEPPPVSELLPVPATSDNEDVWHDADSDQPNTSEVEQTKLKGFSTPKHKLKKKRKSGKAKTPQSQYNCEGPIKLLESAVLKLQLKDEQKGSEYHEKQKTVSEVEARLLDAINKKINSTDDIEEKILQAIDNKIGFGLESRLLDVIDQKIKNSIEEKSAQMDVQVNQVSANVCTELSEKFSSSLNEVNMELRRITNLIATESLRNHSISEFDPLRSRVFNIENKVNVLVDTLKAILRLNDLNSAAESLNIPVTQRHVGVGPDSTDTVLVHPSGPVMTTESHVSQDSSTIEQIPLRADGDISNVEETENLSENLNPNIPARTSAVLDAPSIQDSHKTEAGSTNTHSRDEDESASIISSHNETLQNRQEASMRDSSQEHEPKSLLNPSLVVHSEKVIHGGSAFQAHLYSCQESDISQIHEEMAASFGKDARHNILLFNGEEMLADNDGEHNADSKLAEIFLNHSKKGDIIIITRWYDGKHIGPVRWRIMKNVMREVLEKRDGPRSETSQSATGLHKVQLPAKTAGIHKVELPERKDSERYDNSRSSLLLLTDSTVDKHKSTKGTLVSNYRAPTLRTCITAVSYPKIPRTQIVTGVGANDVEKLTLTQFKEQLIELGDKLHENYPSTRVYMMAIPPGTDKDRNLIVTQFNKAMEEFCREHRFTFLDTYVMLERKCADRKHPSEDGKQLISKLISACIQGNALGMLKKLTADEMLSRQSSYAEVLKSGADNRQIETIITQGVSQDHRSNQTSNPQTQNSHMNNHTHNSHVPHPPQLYGNLAHSYPSPAHHLQGAPHIAYRQHSQNQTATHVTNSPQAPGFHQPQSQTPAGFEGSFQPHGVSMHYNKPHVVYPGMPQFQVPTHAPMQVLQNVSQQTMNEPLWNSPEYHSHWENDYVE